MRAFRDSKLLEIIMQTQLNLVFLLGMFFLNTSLCADNDTRLDNTFERLKKVFPTIQCNQQKLLSRYEGHYVKKDYWIGLEKTKNHALSSNQESNLMTVNIDKDGFVGLGYSYHEGQNFECTFEKDNVLWSCVDNWCEKLQIDHQKQLFISESTYELKELASLPKVIPMVGPLIRVGKFRDYTVYFEKIFQHKCYISDVGEKWCFGKDEISIDEKIRKAYLKLDMSEIPEYGNTLTFDYDYNEDMFVFVPYENGWKIFQDTWLTIENHIPVNPLTDKPWRILLE
jgi:hypothetical protein